MVTWLLLGIAVHYVAVFLPAPFFLGRKGLGAYMGARDDEPEEAGLYGRARRVLRNSNENIAVFVGLAAAALALDAPEGGGADMGLATTGAALFVIARAAFIPLYLLGVPWVRSIAWIAGFVGLIMMGAALL